MLLRTQMSLKPAIPTPAPSLPNQSQFVPPTPFIRLAASSIKTMRSGSRTCSSYLLASPKRARERRDAEKTCFSPAHYVTFVLSTAAGPVDRLGPLVLQGLFSVRVGVWRTRELQGASIIWKHVPSISCFSRS